MPHGAYLLFAYTKKAKPTVVMWNGDLEPEFRTVADSFEEFIGLLSNEPTDD